MSGFNHKKIFIAKRIGVEMDDYGNELPYFEESKEYYFSYMPTTSQVDYQLYGVLINNMFTSYLPMNYLGRLHSGDVCYLIDGETQEIELINEMDLGNKYKPNANYRIKSVQPQAQRVKIIFEKIKKK